MKFFYRCMFGVFFFNLSLWFCAAQNIGEEAVLSTSSVSALKGIWENSERVVLFTEDKGGLSAKIVLKPFYRYYYDGIYSSHSDMDNLPLVAFDEGVYVQFWTAVPSGTGVFWRPEANRREFSTDTVPVQTELKGYYTDESEVYEIRYWLTKTDFSSEKAELHLQDKTVALDKYIDIGSAVYTCAVGRRKIIRNPQRLESLPQKARISADGKLLVFGAPYLRYSQIVDLKKEIERHNSILRPPHDGRAKFVEPLIYKKLENMSIEDFKLKPQRGRVP